MFPYTPISALLPILTKIGLTTYRQYRSQQLLPHKFAPTQVSIRSESMPGIFQEIELLQASVDEDSESNFRLLHRGEFVKYVTVAPKVFANEDMCFAPTLIPLLPTFPTGDWNDG